MKLYTNIKHLLGIDSDVFWVFASKLALIGKGPVLVFLVIATLTTKVQGVWFTFISLSYLTTFGELGFTLLITQFVSHEFINVSLISGWVRGKRESRDKFFTLIRYAIKLYIVIIPILLLLMVVIGLYIFKNNLLEVKIAWVLFAILGAIHLFINLLQSIYQGMDKVTYIYRAKSIGTLLFFIVAAIMLIFGFGIWSIVVSTALSAMFLLLNLFKHSRYFWIQLYRHKPKINYRWMNEIIKLQGKYAVSWVSGYAIFHLLVPITYVTLGAATAGQIGATMTLITGLSAISMSWIEAKIPKFNMLIAKRQKLNLDKLFISSSLRGIFIFIFGAASFLFIIHIVGEYQAVNLESYVGIDRLLEDRLILLLITAEFAGLTIAILAKYLRAHKAEPFYILSVIFAMLIVLCIYKIIPNYGLEYYFYAIIIINWLIMLPLSIIIFRRFVNKFYLDK